MLVYTYHLLLLLLQDEEYEVQTAILTDNVAKIEQMITQNGIDVNAVILVSILVTIRLHVITVYY